MCHGSRASPPQVPLLHWKEVLCLVLHLHRIDGCELQSNREIKKHGLLSILYDGKVVHTLTNPPQYQLLSKCSLQELHTLEF
jgi:hypothetical protein